MATKIQNGVVKINQIDDVQIVNKKSISINIHTTGKLVNITEKINNKLKIGTTDQEHMGNNLRWSP